ncbi:transcriptional regulator, GntR family [Sulfitobacter pontiacus]|jgi:DNA-binding transcriptional MocR family regulator|uniref:Transcriptional regulator, GntR family n=1 Tax=Sulfitobacter pontiacus TaxID=60137 RepID=A0A1H2TQJ7_9RHOB|nr:MULTISPECIES: PLP-dependent aminotransferase family protein [Sulfitobacter]QPO07679.1 PLP-dependent aminotransferase family protein [Sulfitobacter sp. B30-2]SDW46193.1 transcriptional regulator, GntR family [Sulfitobacter pontiacus]
MGTIWQPDQIDGPGPKYKAVVTMIRNGISNGALSAGEKLPPVRELAWKLGVTPGTVARAYTMLTESGTLQAEVGRGTFVALPPTTPDRNSPIEMDVIAHHVHQGTKNYPADTYAVNMFSPHLPSAGQATLIRNLMAEVAQDPASGVMHYPSRTGARPAREAVVKWLAGTPLGSFTEADVILSHGGQNGLSLVFQSILQGRRPAIAIEELSYPGFRRAGELLRADVIPVAMDKDGVIPEALDEVARNHDLQIFCTSPEVHNPTAGFTPVARREALVEVARKHDFQIVEDDCYRMRVERAPTYRMLAPERGWYVSSLAKTLTPALRIGFAIGPRQRTPELRRVAEYNCFGLATPLIDLCAKLLVHPDIDTIAEGTRQGFNAYVQSAVNILGGYDVAWRTNVPFLWLSLPVGWRAGAFCQAAEGQGVQIRSAEEFVCRDARAPHAVRLAINAGVALHSFEDAIMRLRHLLDSPPEQLSV